MGYTKKRVGGNGKPRYTACYLDLKGRLRSAGTYAAKKEAERAWQTAEAELAKGRTGDPARGRQRFRDYVETTWLPNHEIEASTREAYTYSLYKHLMPEFGGMRMIDILPEHVRNWVAKLKDLGVTPVTIRYNKILLSAIFTTALNDQITYIHPCRGVKTPPVPRKPLQIITPEQFDDVYHALPDGDFRLVAETEIESGLRWGELTELRVKDLHTRTRILTVSRAVVQVDPKFHPEGGRFLVKDYPKNRKYRRFKLSAQISEKLEKHIDVNGLVSDDLLFALREDAIPAIRSKRLPASADLGMTEPNENGRSYRHATLSAYTAGKCRCDHCKAAFARYRAERRAKGKDNPRTPRIPQTDGHIPSDWFRRQIWNPAIEAAALDFRPTMRDLRHAHASWLLHGGADLQVVKERLGHASIATTERYLHTLPDADETALTALERTRSRARS
ncbi:tyrosine-type recombinase/integrase [Actinomadura harenae]|uniref:Site-specific integrase n=1 Tax=Actinomadura harenae TaxID=2483351 RepID=A0A3M2MG34_9ACTN|nr:site-specific integrase [Actinomadura harenae]RMI47813.1 site-specific integrase [Actinomadura harenae]